jgi:toxin-antitoxin system PIN domain toxin
VILVDANLLVYATAPEFPQHDRARTWLDARLNGRAPIGLPWPSLLAFVRLVCNPRVFERPRSIASAWDQVEAWLGCEPAWVPAPSDRHREILAGLIPAVPRSDLVADAHLAALAIEHGLTLCSTDGDFARFVGLRWENPLA